MPHPNVIVLHTTEGSSFPSYGGGGSAPNFTVKGGVVRQHFDANESSRALVNASGGVQTNVLNVVQIELVGTCTKGGPGLYWPDASDADMAALVDLVKWLTSEYPIPVVSTSKPWLAYPSSYGSTNGQRMSFSEWENFRGICGHMHVPENLHGDPGNFPIKRLIELVKGAPASSGGSSSGSSSAGAGSSSSGWDGKSYPGASAFGIGKSHPAVTLLGKRLAVHGFDARYHSGPGPQFSETDRLSTQDFQLAQGWTGTAKGGDADGYPGSSTWARLMAAPKSAGLSLNAAVKPGGTHTQVRVLQQLLIEAGYGPIDGAVTAFYGPATEAAVKRFHKKNPVLASSASDPAIGPKGWLELQREAAA
ncbi:peptidoglycan-binding protein [Streptomyces nitrosporeus]|uniref:peptidoglycan-binding protein n=1 Tax=Streptomyces nitrosporeus TaxID=28894 RepID=UPI00331E660F